MAQSQVHFPHAKRINNAMLLHYNDGFTFIAVPSYDTDFPKMFARASLPFRGCGWLAMGKRIAELRTSQDMLLPMLPAQEILP